RILLHRLLEEVVVALDPFHPLEGELGDGRSRIDLERLGEESLALRVVRPGGGPGCEHLDRILGARLGDEDLRYTGSARARLGYVQGHAGRPIIVSRRLKSNGSTGANWLGYVGSLLATFISCDASRSVERRDRASELIHRAAA